VNALEVVSGPGGGPTGFFLQSKHVNINIPITNKKIYLAIVFFISFLCKRHHNTGYRYTA
jgi:hypothetical protein